MLQPLFLAAGFVFLANPTLSQTVEIRSAETLTFPGLVDSNSPAHWKDGRLFVFNSIAIPIRSSGAGPFGLSDTRGVLLSRYDHVPMWIEATWMDDDGLLYAWYHHEPGLVCGSESILTAPKIGALISYDNGATFYDFGIVLESGDANDCNSVNGYFAGGHGDFSVILDRNREYFYFFYGNYAGPFGSQGAGIARMAFADRKDPAGRVWKFDNGLWTQPGLGGRTGAVFPAQRLWNETDIDSFWGPSVHWNSYIERYVMLLNRSCCGPGWPQEGVYISFNDDIANPVGWATPMKLIDNVGWYPQVVGLETNGSDKEAGHLARLYIFGESRWELVFHRSEYPGVISNLSPESVKRTLRPAAERPRHPRRGAAVP